MRALTILPGTADSGRLEEFAEPSTADGSVLVRTLAVGVCGTDLELLAGRFGRPPAGRDRLVLGHESLGRVTDAPPDCGLVPGDFVAGIVRRPDAPPCENCAAGEWDMCLDGRFTEYGIVGRDGFCADRFRAPTEFLVKVDPRLGDLGVLLEPASVAAKVWERIDRIAATSYLQPRRALVTGAGPIGLLVALMGVRRGLEVVVVDRVTNGPKPGLVRELAASYHAGPAADAGPADVVVECTGATPVILDVLLKPGAAVTCLLGGCCDPGPASFDLAAFTGGLIGGNRIVFGSVNSNRRHYEAAMTSLLDADPNWLRRLITRRVPLERWHEATRRDPDDVKTVIDLEN